MSRYHSPKMRCYQAGWSLVVLSLFILALALLRYVNTSRLVMVGLDGLALSIFSLLFTAIWLDWD